MDKGKERKLLMALYPDTPNAEIAQRLGVSKGMVKQKARYLGLRKDPKYLSDVNRKCGSQSSIAKRYWKCLRES